MTANLSAGTATGEGADTMAGIEALFGTVQGDHLIGDDGPNSFFGSDGDDLIEAGDGDDFIDGGTRLQRHLRSGRHRQLHLGTEHPKLRGRSSADRPSLVPGCSRRVRRSPQLLIGPPA